MKNIYFMLALGLTLMGCQTHQKSLGSANINLNGNDKDSSANIAIEKMEDGILFKIDVKDDVIIGSNSNIYKNDMVELYFDLRPIRKRGINKYKKGVFKLDISPCFFANNANSLSYYPKTYQTKIPGIELKSNLTETGYYIELFMPNSGIKENHYIFKSYFYMDIAISDVDSNKDSQKISLSNKEKSWKYPFNFKKITLSENR